MKISTQLRRFPEKKRAELVAYNHLQKLDSSHPGTVHIRKLYDSFEISGPHGSHQCLIQQPMHLSILEMMDLNPEPLNAPLLRMILKCLLKVLDFLHTEAGMVHTDLKADNLMLTVEDNSMLEDFEKIELESPTPRKVIDGTRSIYRSRYFTRPKNGDWGYPMLCDFGEARIGTIHHTGMTVQPHIYRAPEVTLEMPWGPAVDIWNLATLIWDLFEGRHLFNGVTDRDGDYDPFAHMAQITGFLGPPPKEFIQRSKTISQVFDANGTRFTPVILWGINFLTLTCIGKWVADHYEKVPSVSLEDVETRLEGQDKELFLKFIRSMLEWLPEDRKTAKELLDDPWLNIE
ncbi:putative non-specific serine/threonine protein kinase [Microsporum canis]